MIISKGLSSWSLSANRIEAPRKSDIASSLPFREAWRRQTRKDLPGVRNSQEGNFGSDTTVAIPWAATPMACVGRSPLNRAIAPKILLSFSFSMPSFTPSKILFGRICHEKWHWLRNNHDGLVHGWFVTLHSYYENIVHKDLHFFPRVQSLLISLKCTLFTRKRKYINQRSDKIVFFYVFSFLFGCIICLLCFGSTQCDMHSQKKKTIFKMLQE